jgi:hypothetical protein
MSVGLYIEKSRSRFFILGFRVFSLFPMVFRLPLPGSCGWPAAFVWV